MSDDISLPSISVGITKHGIIGLDESVYTHTYVLEYARAAVLAERQNWQALAAAVYQAAGAYDMPVRVLDALSAAANGEPFAHLIDGLLPVDPPALAEMATETKGLRQLANVVAVAADNSEEFEGPDGLCVAIPIDDLAAINDALEATKS